MAWYVGGTMRLTGAFTVSGVAVEPSSVTVVVTDPSGNTETYAASYDEENAYYYVDVSFTMAGWWKWRMYSEGTYEQANQGAVFVTPVNTGS